MNQLDAALRQVDALLGKRQNQAALALLRQLVGQLPNHPGLLLVAARTAVMVEQLGLASGWLQQLESAPLPSAELGIQVVRLQRQCGLLDRAVGYLERLREHHPDELSLLLEAAAMARSGGETEQARDLYRQALDRQPGCSAALVFLARDRQSDPDQVLKQVESVLSANGGETAGLWFAAGRCHERSQRHQQAFDAYDRGNQLFAGQGSGFGLDRKIDAAPAFVAEFSKAALQAAARTGHSSTLPTFVVGMPRSGTTLTEQIIAAHPDCAAVGERRIVGNLLKQRLGAAEPGLSLFDALTTVDGGLATLGQSYLDQLSVLMPEPRQRVVDKMPFNFTLVGPCHLMFPQAPIIHTERDPLDVCWSMFTTGFQAQVLRLSLAEIGQLYGLHEFLMDHWRQVCPVHSVSYRSLVEDFEGQARGLVDAIGLPWHADCLDFHRGKGDVRTASAAQVRQPIYASSLNRAAAFQPWLGDFERAREATLKTLQSAA